MVLALRADFYGRCAEEAALAEQLAGSQVLVGPMGRDEYRSVIEGPAAGAGLTVEPALVERLIDEVEGRPGSLPLLSTALVELWERRDGRTIALSALAATGGISGAVGRLAENAYGQLTDAEQATARIVFLRLVGGEGEAIARRRVPLAEFDVATNADVQQTLTVLTAARLLTIDRGTVEVAHEALFREWPRLGTGSRRTSRAGACAPISPRPPTNGTRAAALPASCTGARASPPSSIGAAITPRR